MGARVLAFAAGRCARRVVAARGGLQSLHGLLATQGHLGGHHPLPVHHQLAVGAAALPPPAQALVSLDAGYHAVVAAPGALGRPQQTSLSLAIPILTHFLH